MDANYGIPLTLSVLGVVLFAASAILGPDPSPTRYTVPVTAPKESQKPAANANTGSQQRYHYSRQPIQNPLSNRQLRHVLTPSGLWYAYDRQKWLDFAIDGGIYKEGEKLYLYLVTFKTPPKLYSIKAYSDALALCSNMKYVKKTTYRDMTLEKVQWDELKNEGYDGVELLPGVVDEIFNKWRAESSSRGDTSNVTCLDALRRFDVDSGCMWNVDKVTLTLVDTITVPGRPLPMYHYSRTKIDRPLIHKGDPGGFKPKGFWFAFTRTDWLDYTTGNGIFYKPGEKLHLYSVSFKNAPKIYSVKTVDDIKNICNLIEKREITDGKVWYGNDWNVLKRMGYDGVQLLPGAVSLAKGMRFRRTLRCSDILGTFDVDSGCMWNVKDVVLQYEETITVPQTDEDD